MFYDTITYHLDEYAPYRKLTKKEVELSQKPWITNSILSKCKERDSIPRSISKEKNQVLLESMNSRYEKLRNEITQEKRKSKKDYLNNFFETNKQRSSQIWKGINLLINAKSSKSSNYKLNDDNNNIISDMDKITNIFNNHFSTIGAKVGNKIPAGRGSYSEYLSKRDNDNKLFLNPSHSIFLNPTSPLEIRNIIDSLDHKKSMGPISVPAFVLKTYNHFFSEWLSKLINLSFQVGVFPDIFKVARVTPVHKKESKLDYSNYQYSVKSSKNQYM